MFQGVAKKKITAAIERFSQQSGIPLEKTHLKVRLDFSKSMADGEPTEDADEANLVYSLVKDIQETVVESLPFHEISGSKVDFVGLEGASQMMIRQILRRVAMENGIEQKYCYGILLLNKHKDLKVVAVHEKEGVKKVYGFMEMFE